MYAWLRRIHLYSGLTLLLFVLMYFVTGAVMTHPWLVVGREETQAVREIPFGPLNGSPSEVAEAVRKPFQIAGRMTEAVREPGGDYVLTYANAGVETEVRVASGGGTARVTTRRANVSEAMNRLHRIRGYGGGWFYWVWALVYDLASVAMIVFAMTGIYLWYTLTRRRLLGWILLTASFGYAAGITAYLLLTK